MIDELLLDQQELFYVLPPRLVWRIIYKKALVIDSPAPFEMV